MVTDGHVRMLLDDGSYAMPTSQLNKACKSSSEPFVGPFDEADCLDDSAAGHEYTEDEVNREGLCMMSDVSDSYHRAVITMDRVSLVCDGQTEGSECCGAKELSSTHNQMSEHNGQKSLFAFDL